MQLSMLARWSLKSRVTLFMLVIFLLSLWSLSYYAAHMLRNDLRQVLGQQQFATVSLIASELGHEFERRQKALEKVAHVVGQTMLADPAAAQAILDQNLILSDLFNAGVTVYRPDGAAIAEVPRSQGRVGLNYMNNQTVAAVLTSGEPAIGDVQLGTKLQQPVFGMAVPIRNPQGQVIGALSAIINLGAPNFLDLVMEKPYGQTGGYLLAAPKQRLIVTATDKSRIMERLPPLGVNTVVDRFLEGYEGSAVFTNPRGIEMLASDKTIKVVHWTVAAVLPTSEAYAPIHAMQQRLLLATLILTLLAGPLSWWMLRRQLAPMLATVKTLGQLANSGQTPHALAVTHHDEFGELVDGFNGLLATLSHRETALTESAQRYQQLVDDLQVGIVIHAPSGEITMSNQLALELLGLSKDQLLGKTSLDPSWDVIHEDGTSFPGDSHPAAQALRSRSAVDHVVMGVFRPTTKDRVWLLVTAKPQLNTDGILHQVVVTFSNITKRKLAEKALERSEAFKNTVLNSLPAEIAVVDAQGTIQAVNDSWRRFSLTNLGTPGQHALGVDVGANYLSACDETARNGIQAVLDGHLPAFSLEYPCHTPHQKRWFSMTVVPLGQDVHNGAVIAHTDITAQKVATQYEQHRNHILELLASDHSVPVILEALVTGVEQMRQNTLCSILLLSTDGRHLERGIAPSLPDFYNAALDGAEIGPSAGSCGTAAFTGERVIVEDIATHPFWAPYKVLAAQAGLGSCWSQPFRASNGQVLGTFAMYHPSAHTPEPADITLIEQSAQLASIAIEKNMAADRLRESEAHFRLLTEQVSDVIWRQDQHNVFTYISPADERLRGYRADEVIGQHVSTLLTEEGIATLANVTQRRLNAEQQGTPTNALTFELQQRCKDGRLIWTEVLSTPERDVQGKIIGYHGVTREITERKQMQDQVRQLAFFDPLTHLPNRRMLDDRLTQAMATSARTGRYGALMFLDLDNFKPLNDTHGHEAGDYLLVEVARRLKTCVREVDTVVRIGGDEFVVMLSELSIDQTESSLQAGAVAEKIRLALAQPYVLTVRHAGQADKTVEHHCSASLGVALFVNHHTSQVDILKWADAAMYQAKDAGRNRVRFFGNKNTPLAGL